MNTNIEDLNNEQPADEEQQILADTSNGATEDEREQSLSKAKNYAMGYRIAGMGVGVCAIIVLMSHSDMIMYLVLLIFPIIGIWVMRLGNGIITLLPGKSNPTSAEAGFLVPVFALCFFSFTKYNLVNIAQLIIPGLVIAAVFFYMLYSIVLKKIRVAQRLQIGIAALIAVCYGFGCATIVNCAFDQTDPQYYVSKITDMRMHEGSRSTYYHLYLSQWGPYEQSGKIAVSSSLYSEVRIGTRVRVTMRKGTLGVPYYYLEKP